MLETLAALEMLEVVFPTTDGRRLVMPRYTQLAPEQKLLYTNYTSACRISHHLKVKLAGNISSRRAQFVGQTFLR